MAGWSVYCRHPIADHSRSPCTFPSQSFCSVFIFEAPDFFAISVIATMRVFTRSLIQPTFDRHLLAPRFACSTPLRSRKRSSRGRSSKMDFTDKSDPLPGMFGRRGFLTGVGATLLHATLAEYRLAAVGVGAELGDDPFTLGVASGDPTSDGVVLWTRLAPKPLEGRRHAGPPVAVQWRIATDEHMRRIVDRGSVWALPGARTLGARGSRRDAAGRWYWYQFKSAASTARSAAPGRHPASARRSGLRFAFVSCQHYANGLYYAHRHWRRRLWTSPCTWVTTSTRDVRRVWSAVRTCPITRLRRSKTIGFDTGSTSPIRICRPSTRRSPGS